MTTDNRFFTVETEARQQFYKVPKEFMCEDSKYFSMNAMSKLLYGVLTDRNSLSMKNGWVDEQRRIFFIFNQEELCKVMGVKDTKTIRKYLKELEKYGLLLRKRMGQSMPDRLYLLQVETSESLENQLMGKNSLSRRGKFPGQEGENFPTNKTNNNNTEYIYSSSKGQEEDDDEKKQDNDFVSESEQKVKRVLSHCQKCNFRLTKKTVEKLILSYQVDAILKAITTAVNCQDDIKKPGSYIMAVLNDMSSTKTINRPTTENKNSYNDFPQRDYSKQDISELEYALLNRGGNQ